MRLPPATVTAHTMAFRMACLMDIWGPCLQPRSLPLAHSISLDTGSSMPASRQPCPCIKVIEPISPLSPRTFSSMSFPMSSMPISNPILPPHWNFNKYKHSWCRPIYLTYRFLCVIGFGTGNLGRVWKGTYEDCPEEEFDRVSERLRRRFEHLNLVVRPQRFNRHFAGFDCNA